MAFMRLSEIKLLWRGLAGLVKNFLGLRRLWACQQVSRCPVRRGKAKEVFLPAVIALLGGGRGQLVGSRAITSSPAGEVAIFTRHGIWHPGPSGRVAGRPASVVPLSAYRLLPSDPVPPPVLGNLAAILASGPVSRNCFGVTLLRRRMETWAGAWMENRNNLICLYYQ